MEIIEILLELKEEYIERLNKIIDSDYIDEKNITNFECEEIIKKNNISNKEIFLRFKNYINSSKKNLNSALESYCNSPGSERRMIVAMIFNDILKRKNVEKAKARDNIKKKINLIDMIIAMLNGNYKEVDFDFLAESFDKLKIRREKFDEVMKLIKDLIFEKSADSNMAEFENIDLEKNESSANVLNILNSKINNFDMIKETFERYSSLIPEYIIDVPNDSSYTKDELIEALDLEGAFFDEEQYIFAIKGILNLLEKTNNPKQIDALNKYMDIFSSKYQLYIMINALHMDIENIWRLYSNLGEDISDILIEKRSMVTILGNKKVYDVETMNSFNTIFQELYELKRKLLYGNIETMDAIPIKAFVLFDGVKEKSQGYIPYILTDLDPNSTKNCIDNSINTGMVSNGYNSFNELIDDMIILGTPKVLLGNTDKIAKFISPIYKSYSEHEKINRSMSNSTGMVRVRPNVISYVRFVDEKITLIPHTTKFNQIVELLQSKLKNVKIDPDKPFVLFINYLDAFKKSDLSSYSKPEKRQEKSILRSILKSKTDSFTSEELYLLSMIIDSTLKAYSALEKQNENFDFKIISKIDKNKKL